MKKIASIMTVSVIMISVMIISARADITVTTFHEPGAAVKSQTAANTGGKTSSSKKSTQQASSKMDLSSQQGQQNEGRYIPSENGAGDPK